MRTPGASDSEPTEPAPRDNAYEVEPIRMTIASSLLESKFRRFTAHRDALQVIVALTVLTVPLIGLAYHDYLLFGPGPRLLALLVLRAIVVCGAAYVIRVVRTESREARRDRLLLAWWLVFAACVTVIDSTRPLGQLVHVPMDVLCVLTAYVVPTRWLHQVVAGSAITVGTASVFIASAHGLEPIHVGLVLLAYAYANTLGIFVSRHLHGHARAEYVSRVLERRARSTLRALSHLVPMCAGCKSIKDASGKWHRVEAYVHAETGQDVTHGLCPQCVRELYPELADRILASDEAERDDFAQGA